MVYLIKRSMNLKIHAIIISLIIAFTLITTEISTAFVNVFAQGDGGNDTQGQQSGNMTKENWNKSEKLKTK